MFFNDAELATGTAFFYEHKNSTHLVTNWHNATGLQPKTRKILHSSAAVPNKLHLCVPSKTTVDGHSAFSWTTRILDLYKDESMLEPEYFTHPVHGENVDLVTYPIDGLEKTAIVTANSTSLGLSQIRLRPSLDVFVLGHPLGMSGGAFFPIWKRGSIATEPEVNLDKLPKLLIDTATRQGMSGSPVYAQETGFFFEEGKTDMKDATIGSGRRFVGIYSGRVGDDTFQAQLGIVWKVSAIEETIEHSLAESEKSSAGKSGEN